MWSPQGEGIPKRLVVNGAKDAFVILLLRLTFRQGCADNG